MNNNKEKQLLDILQSSFPVEENPYQILADQLDMPPDELFEKVRRLIQTGVIRRIGPSLDGRKFGFVSTLAAVAVPQDRITKASEIIAGYAEVTHSYLRKDAYNIWFTLIAESQQRIAAILDQIRQQLSLEESSVLNLPMKRLFKLDGRFKSPLE